MKKLEKKLAEWHDKKYGKESRDVLRMGNRTVFKAVEELGELTKALLRNDVKNAREEAADVAIVLVHLVRMMGSSLHEEMKRKYKIIMKRLAKAKAA